MLGLILIFASLALVAALILLCGDAIFYRFVLENQIIVVYAVFWFSLIILCTALSQKSEMIDAKYSKKIQKIVDYHIANN
ncbi:MAG: hypothetical protein MHMPM18_001250 [Marteilia pararefringens]